MTLLYTLDEHDQPVACDDPIAWAMWMAEHDRHVAKDMDEGDEHGTVRVSTIFAGVDLGMPFFNGPPVLWETMIFGGVLDGTCRRYASREAALAGHQELCAKVSGTIHRTDTSTDPQDRPTD